MKIHIDAIEKSRVADIQYVLKKNTDTACISDKKQLLTLLKDGWDIVGKYNNGAGYDNYKTTDEKEISCIKSFIEKELLGFEIKSASTVTISFQEFFEPVTCESEDLRAFIVFHHIVNGKFEHEGFRFNGENAKKVRDVVLGLNMKQDKATVIDLLEKKNKGKCERKQTVSKVGAKEFKRRIVEKIKQIDNAVQDDDLYFSQTARGYYLGYVPDYPDSSERDLIVYQDLNGSISVHGNEKSFYPGVSSFEDIFAFENDKNFQN